MAQEHSEILKLAQKIPIHATCMIHTAKSSALFEKGIKARVLSMHTLKPIDKKAILDAAHNIGGILTIEEHSLIG